MTNRVQIINPQIDDYLGSILPARDTVLLEMEALAKKRNFPIIGPQVGRLLYLLTKSIDARRILELGSGFGYSAYWFALALPDDGEVICTEFDPGNIKLAKDFLGRAGLLSKIQFISGDGGEVLDQAEHSFDIILNDADKEQYPALLKRLLPKLQKGGILVTDNLLWHGAVLDDKPDEATRGVQKYNKLIMREPRLFTTIIPLRDGVGLSLKL